MAKKEIVSQEAAFTRCVDFLVQMIEKYGAEVQIEIENENIKENKVA